MINDLKELEKLLKLCRKQGVTEINLGTVAFKLGDLPDKSKEEEETVSNFPSEVLTPDQLMFYSAGGVPSEDPENQGVQ